MASSPQSSPTPKPARAPAKKRRKVGGVTLEVDLKVDSPKIREMERRDAKRKGFKWALALIIVICLAALLKITVRESFLNNPQFSLRQIAVRTEGPLTAQKIVRASALTSGTNLLTINMRELRGRLMLLPQVKDVKITRNYEGLLTLEVKQRQPVAWLECSKLKIYARRPDGGHFVDEEGVSFPCDVMTPAYEALPVIRYEALSQNTPGAPIPDFQVKSALSLLQQLQKRFEQVPDEVRLLDIQTPYSIVAAFADQSLVTFGVDDLEPQLARLDRVRHDARQRRWQIATLNLLVRHNVPVTFRTPPDLKGLQDTVASTSNRPKTAQHDVR